MKSRTKEVNYKVSGLECGTGTVCCGDMDINAGR